MFGLKASYSRRRVFDFKTPKGFKLDESRFLALTVKLINDEKVPVKHFFLDTQKTFGQY